MKKLSKKNIKNLNSTCYCETAQTKNNPANCFCVQSNETQKAKRQCGRIDVGIGATKLTPLGLAMTEQVGRSLVEMLGVLAVMGVLSVAGVSAYNNAMNRHRANELLNEASKRATVVAAQVLQGRTTFSIDEFSATNEKLGFTGVQENPKNPQQFQLKLSGVDEKVCTQMRTLVGTNTPVREINENCTIITYNKDLSTTIYASDFNADTTGQKCLAAGFTWCPKWGSGTCSENSDCCAHQEISECQQCNSETGEITNAKNYLKCDYNTENKGYCLSGICKGDEKICDTNEDCGGVSSGYFCEYPSYDPETYCTSNTETAMNGRVGFCHLIGEIASSQALLDIDNTTVLIPAGRFITSSFKMNWWSAKNWCAAQSGKSMVTNADLNCYRGTDTGAGYNHNKCCSYGNTDCVYDISKLSLPIQAMYQTWPGDIKRPWLVEGDNCWRACVNLRPGGFYSPSYHEKFGHALYK